MIRLGLCCIFRNEPIKFRRTTAKYLSRFPRDEQLDYLSGICLHNAKSLLEALIYCEKNQILDFRINSQILPLKTHHEVGYDISELPGHKDIVTTFQSCGKYCRKNNIRTTFHPDQFILLSSPTPSIVVNSIKELEYHAEVSEWVRADIINLHAGGAYGDKKSALKRLAKQIDKVPGSIRSRLTLENDDRIFTPYDLIPLCKDMGIPLVYDVHHHRCLPDDVSVEKTTRQAIDTWDREPVLHLSSPKSGWHSKDPRPHHDYINPSDFPDYWRDLDITVEVEAKAKELAVLKLKKELGLND
ncbi:MAG: UV DNA damage repair endonuclease UvsE [Desulfobacterales bacterium]|jgi:UV DNA damage endonuclease|nr:UV DNA damage repair endonuclease UvsE [Desulfobacterales bacterium]